jgi:hypothetical protein
MDGRAARAPAAIAGELLPKLLRQAECYRKPVISELADHRILLRRWDELTEGGSALPDHNSALAHTIRATLRQAQRLHVEARRHPLDEPIGSVTERVDRIQGQILDVTVLHACDQESIVNV